MKAIDQSKTRRFYLLMKERITSGALLPGHRLPSEPRLAAFHHLSRVTIRRALDGLSRDGLIIRKPGAGTFVRDGVAGSPVAADLTDMLAQLVTMGRATRVKLLSFEYGEPPPAVAQDLRLEHGEQTQRAERVRTLDGVPFSYLLTYVPASIGRTYTRKELGAVPLLELIGRSGVIATAARQTISATLAGPEVAAALGVDVGSPLLSLVRVVSARDGSGIEYLSALYRPDVHVFRMEMKRAGDGASHSWRPARDQNEKPTSRRAVTSGRRPR